MVETWQNEQIHNRRRKAGIVHVDKQAIVDLGKFVASEFPGEHVAVITGMDNQSTRLLEMFEKSHDQVGSTDYVRIVANMREGDGFLRQLAIELGPDTNFVQAQSFDENWAIGAAERGIHRLRPYELPKFFHFDYLGSIINGLILVIMISVAPSIDATGDRFVYVASLVLMMFLVAQSFKILVPNAYIVLNKEKIPRAQRIVNKYLSSVLGLLWLAVSGYISMRFDESIGSIVESISGALH